jgi:hypothetical protein
VNEHGHSPGTAPPESLELQGLSRRALDARSCVPGWPRLLDVHQAAAYLGVSFWTFRELINAGNVPVVRLPRPQTERAQRRRPLGDTVRRLSSIATTSTDWLTSGRPHTHREHHQARQNRTACPCAEARQRSERLRDGAGRLCLGRFQYGDLHSLFAHTVGRSSPRGLHS